MKSNITTGLLVLENHKLAIRDFTLMSYETYTCVGHCYFFKWRPYPVTLPPNNKSDITNRLSDVENPSFIMRCHTFLYLFLGVVNLV